MGVTRRNTKVPDTFGRLHRSAHLSIPWAFQAEESINWFLILLKPVLVGSVLTTAPVLSDIPVGHTAVLSLKTPS